MKLQSVDEYIKTLEPNIQKKISALREFILNINPCITETISYNMPAYKCKKVVFYYYVFKNHIGLFPTPEPIVVFQTRLSWYKTAKGAIQIPLDEDIPYELVKDIIDYNIIHQ